MKRLIIPGLFFLLSIGCNHNPVSTNNIYSNPSFTITNTRGVSSTIFTMGEQFNMSFQFINSYNYTLNYFRGSTEPPVVFEILKNDNIIATSVDGYAFAQIVIGGSLAPGDTLKNQWTAPNTINQIPKVILTPGSYQAKVLYPSFGQSKADSYLIINFQVVQQI